MKLRIRIADDEELIRKSLVKLLTAEGHEVDAVGTAAEVLESVRNDPPQILILDLRLPDGSGLELTKWNSPPGISAEPKVPSPNTLGIGRIMFAVEDIDDVVARLRTKGGELMGEIVNYENVHRLCYMRGPEGIIIALAERIG